MKTVLPPQEEEVHFRLDFMPFANEPDHRPGAIFRHFLGKIYPQTNAQGK